MKNSILICLKEGVKIEEIIETTQETTRGGQIGVERLFDTSNLIQNNVEAERSAENREQQVQEAIEKMNETEKRLYRVYKIDIPTGEDPVEFAKKLNEDSNIEYAEVDEMNELYDVPNDPRFQELYGLEKMECTAAWQKAEGDEIIVAVVDTGVDYLHPDLMENMWQDDFGNFGYNYVNDTSDPMDDHSHGTHVAGTIAAVGNNSIGVVGVAPKAKIMALKGLGVSGGLSSDLAKCIKYAVDNGAHIINNSWGPGASTTIHLQIEYAHSKGVVVFFAAGNSNNVVSSSSSAGHPKTISIAATNQNDNRASFSNYGELVDVAAPGVQILSLRNNTNGYTVKNGTSMACPHAAGLAALMLSVDINLTPDEIKEIMMEEVDEAFTDLQKPIGSGRINAHKVIKKLTTPTLPSPGDLIGILKKKINFQISRDLFTIELLLDDDSTQEMTFDNISDLSACLNILENYKPVFNKTSGSLELKEKELTT